MSKPEYFNLFAWIANRKNKIGYAFYDENTGAIKIKADKHMDATKIGRALMNGGIQIERRKQQNKPAPQVEENYECAADDFENQQEANG